MSALSERERAEFIRHIATLRAQMTELETKLRQKPTVVNVQPRVQVVTAPLPIPMPTRRHSVHVARCALGRLSYAETMALHTPGRTTEDIARVAGVTCSSVSRWRKANGMVPTWVQLPEAPSNIGACR